MAVLATALLAGASACILNGLFSTEQYSLISYVIHFVVVYLGSAVCCGLAKEKKGVCAGVSVAGWYVVLLFVSVVLLECNAGDIVGALAAGLCGYGAALLSCILLKSKGSGRRRKYHPR